MEARPSVWDGVHAYHNPVTGSYHSPPGSFLLHWSDDLVGLDPRQRHDSSPPNLFPSWRPQAPSREPSLAAAAAATAGGKPPQGSSNPGCRGRLAWICGGCCRDLVPAVDSKTEILVR
mmetsp:Transcript_14409/g.36345  ORF Transcript_14409/g.36345 Transcript_14409/m.36345 type:complete len:118 (+) Transcript_14409:63-416(+)